MASEVKVGTVEGTGAAVDVELGFVPDYVKVWSIDAAAVLNEEYIGGVSYTITGATGVITVNVADGISTYAGSATAGSEAGKGFTIGTDLSVNAQTLAYLAIRNA